MNPILAYVFMGIVGSALLIQLIASWYRYLTFANKDEEGLLKWRNGLLSDIDQQVGPALGISPEEMDKTYNVAEPDIRNTICRFNTDRLAVKYHIHWNSYVFITVNALTDSGRTMSASKKFRIHGDGINAGKLQDFLLFLRFQALGLENISRDMNKGLLLEACQRAKTSTKQELKDDFLNLLTNFDFEDPEPTTRAARAFLISAAYMFSIDSKAFLNAIKETKGLSK